MPIEIEGPDGSVVEFPDGTSDLVIQAAMGRAYGRPQKTSQWQGFVEGANRTAANLAPVLGLTNPALASATKLQNEAVQEGVRRREAEGVTSGRTGEFLGSMAVAAPTMFMGGPMASGAISGYAASDADDFGGKLVDAGIGAVGGKIAGAVIGKLAKSLGGTVTDDAVEMARRGVRMSPGQTMGGKVARAEDKAMSRPVIGDKIAADRARSVDDWNRAVLKKNVLEPIGAKLPDDVATGHEAIGFAQQTLDGAYNKLVPQLRTTIDRKMMVDVARLKKGAANLPDEHQAQLDGIIKNLGYGRDGTLSGRALYNAHAEVRRLGSVYRGSADANQRELGRSLRELDDAVWGLIERQNAGLGEPLKATRKAYRGLVVLEDAAKRTDEGVIGPGQLKQSVVRNDPSRRQRDSAAGKAFMQGEAKLASRVLPSKVPNSGSADRYLAGSPIARMQGALESLGYEGQKAINNYAASPQGSWLRVGGSLLNQLRGPVGGAAGASATQVRR